MNNTFTEKNEYRKLLKMIWEAIRGKLFSKKKEKEEKERKRKSTGHQILVGQTTPVNIAYLYLWYIRLNFRSMMWGQVGSLYTLYFICL